MITSRQDEAISGAPPAPGSRTTGCSYGPTRVITDLGLLAPDPRTCELALTHVHPGVTFEQVRAATGWELRAVDALATTPPPTAEELEAVRELERTRPGPA